MSLSEQASQMICLVNALDPDNAAWFNSLANNIKEIETENQRLQGENESLLVERRRLEAERQRLRDALEECVKQMDYAESFICTKVKMNQDGQYCFDLAMRKAKQALEEET